MTDCIFCKIINKQIPTDFLFEDDLVAAFKDARPLAPVHVLIISKQHIESAADFSSSNEQLAGRLIMAAKKIADDLGISQDGYKLLLRVGKNGGQEVPHVHLHLIGGAKLAENIRPL